MAKAGQKIVTTWDYRDKQVSLKIPVLVIDTTKAHCSYLHGDHTKIPGYEANKPPTAYFKVKMDDPEVHECDTDINRLRETVFKAVKDTVAIEWKSMLVVKVSASRKRLYAIEDGPATLRTDPDAKGSLHLEWERWQITEYRGKKIARRFFHYAEPFGHDSEKEEAREVWHQAGNDWPDVGVLDDNRWSDEDMPEIAAMIPDTPENRAALEAINDQIELLYRRLSVLLGSDKIVQTLAHVAANGLAALPAPPVKAIVAPKKRRRR